jgi:type II secretory pathway pseudopilin PulG
MSPQVTAALISGGAALVVAILGISGAIAAQLMATRRAFANSLALAEREYEKQERERAEERRREDEYRHAERRRGTYSAMLRSAASLYLASLGFAAAASDWRNVRDPEFAPESPQEREREEHKTLGALQDTQARWIRAGDELDVAFEEIELLASADVRYAAGELARIASEYPDLGEEPLPVSRLHHTLLTPGTPRPGKQRYWSYFEARDAFLAAARNDLGIGAASALDDASPRQLPQP